MIFVVLALLLRALIAPLLLIATVVLSFAATLGVSAFVFTHIFGFAGADPSFPLFAFVFLVALGIDYNIFLMTRVREETLKFGTRDGILRGLAVTGGVITSAGVVLAATFAVLGVLPLVFLAESVSRSPSACCSTPSLVRSCWSRRCLRHRQVHLVAVSTGQDGRLSGLPCPSGPSGRRVLRVLRCLRCLSSWVPQAPLGRDLGLKVAPEPLAKLPAAGRERKIGSCGEAVLVAWTLFTPLPRNRSFMLSTRLGHLSITQQALQGRKSKIMARAEADGTNGWRRRCALDRMGHRIIEPRAPTDRNPPCPLFAGRSVDNPR